MDSFVSAAETFEVDQATDLQSQNNVKIQPLDRGPFISYEFCNLGVNHHLLMIVSSDFGPQEDA